MLKIASMKSKEVSEGEIFHNNSLTCWTSQQRKKYLKKFLIILTSSLFLDFLLNLDMSSLCNIFDKKLSHTDKEECDASVIESKY